MQSGEISVGLNWGYTPDVWLVKTRDAIEHPTTYRTGPTTEVYPIQNIGACLKSVMFAGNIFPSLSVALNFSL